MKIVCAPNALKGTLTASAAADAMVVGVRRAVPDAEAIALPIADGGDGTCQVLVSALGGRFEEHTVSDPLGRPVRAQYGLVDAGRTAILDVASASGLTRLAPDERDPLRASSFGTGELLRNALRAGVEHVILGIGGSATVDGGVGLLTALGARFLDAAGKPVRAGGAGLGDLAHLDVSALLPEARRAAVTVACDVDNPLLGPDGAAVVFGPQKGAHPEAVRALERGLERLARVLEEATGRDVRRCPFGGGAGGVPATLHAVLDATLVPGIDLVLDRVGFDAALAGADLVLTAEGRLDASSLRNKGPVGVARRARRHGVPTIALAGAIAEDFDASASPFHACIAVTPSGADARAMAERSAEWLTAATSKVVAAFAGSA